MILCYKQTDMHSNNFNTTTRYNISLCCYVVIQAFVKRNINWTLPQGFCQALSLRGLKSKLRRCKWCIERFLSMFDLKLKVGGEEDAFENSGWHPQRESGRITVFPPQRSWPPVHSISPDLNSDNLVKNRSQNV